MTGITVLTDPATPTNRQLCIQISETKNQIEMKDKADASKSVTKEGAHQSANDHDANAGAVKTSGSEGVVAEPVDNCSDGGSVQSHEVAEQRVVIPGKQGSAKDGVVEVLYRIDGVSPGLRQEDVEWKDYSAPFDPLPVEMFEGPCEVLESIYNQPEKYCGSGLRQLQRHDILHVVFSQENLRNVALIVADLDVDDQLSYDGCRCLVQGPGARCPFVLIPLRKTMDPFHTPVSLFQRPDCSDEEQ
ncbi:hypothetical protein [Haloferula sp. A504]|uniref:hypothetical protein n=1 Tax=Haloferula sp. A504 TaxID=3373601 RepID=UPI0031C67ADA|nr:hypothetical protein [Verrucomicrobiaceae bacterium E54]